MTNYLIQKKMRYGPSTSLTEVVIVPLNVNKEIRGPIRLI